MPGLSMLGLSEGQAQNVKASQEPGSSAGVRHSHASCPHHVVEGDYQGRSHAYTSIEYLHAVCTHSV